VVDDVEAMVRKAISSSNSLLVSLLRLQARAHEATAGLKEGLPRSPFSSAHWPSRPPIQ